MLVLALNDEMWAAYDVQQARLYKVWKGGISFNGPMYDNRHQIQPSTQEAAYMVNTARQSLWRLNSNGTERSVQAEFLGYKLKNNQVTIRWEIPIDDENIIVEETPEFVLDESGRPGLERAYDISNVPAGTEVFLQSNFSSLSNKKQFRTDGDFNPHYS